MKTTQRLLCASALLVPLTLAAVPPGSGCAEAETRIEFAPGERSLEKRFTNTMALVLDDMSVLVNGEEPPMMPADLTMNLAFEQTVAVTDEYLAMHERDRGRPLKLRRSFDELGWDTDFTIEMSILDQSHEQAHDMQGSSELEGEQVLFTWDDDQEKYVKALEGGDGDEGVEESLLDGLTEDMGFRNLLPPDAPDGKGTRWNIAGKHFHAFELGGNARLAVDYGINLVDEDMQVVTRVEMSGTVGYSATAE